MVRVWDGRRFEFGKFWGLGHIITVTQLSNLRVKPPKPCHTVKCHVGSVTNGVNAGIRLGSSTLVVEVQRKENRIRIALSMSIFLRRSLRTRLLSSNNFNLFLPNSFDSSQTINHRRHFSDNLFQTVCFRSTSLSTENHCYGYGYSHRQHHQSTCRRFFASEAAATAAQRSTSDGLTVEGILANNWNILDDNESDWKSHASAVAQSIHLIKRRLQWKKLKVRLDMLSVQLNKADLWDDPVHAGNISREHGTLMGKVKEVNALEQELLEHIDMIKLARDENDSELESVRAALTSSSPRNH
ncbi:Peptide chain release factor PrfB2 [Arachis hypogaea]|nr:Peptide chain release factor PrfB2 [Arachis hypogaea]